MLPTITPDKIDLPAGTIVKFPGTIADYEEILQRLGDRSIPRLRFRDHHILLMSPLPQHGKEIDVISVDRAWQVGSSVALREFSQTLD
jgi:urease beta subunit